jgi:hypothetical protein
MERRPFCPSGLAPFSSASCLSSIACRWYGGVWHRPRHRPGCLTSFRTASGLRPRLHRSHWVARWGCHESRRLAPRISPRLGQQVGMTLCRGAARPMLSGTAHLIGHCQRSGRPSRSCAHAPLRFYSSVSSFPSLRLVELLRVLFVAGFLQTSGPRVDHRRYGWLVGVVADAVPLSLGDEYGVALVQAYWLAF